MGEQRTILVVDDNEVIRCLLRDLLGRRGYLVVPVNTAREALAYAERHPVDGALTDLNLGESDGLTLCAQLHQLGRTRGRSLPIWVMSGSEVRDFSTEAAAAGAVAFVRKPFHPAALLRLVDEKLRGSSGAKPS